MLTSLGAGATAATARIADRDCGDFATQKAAQKFFLAHGGPQSDPHRLDSDGDGIACESNPCPCFHGTGGSGGGGDSIPVKDSHVTLTPSRRAGIPGERLGLTVRVTPRKSRLVTIQVRTTGGWRALARGRTNAQGVMQRSSRVTKAVARYRAVVPKTTSGSPRYRAAVSRARVVRPQPQIVRLKAPRFAEQGSKLVVTAVAGPVRQGREFELWSRTAGGGWVRVATGAQDHHGRETFALPTRRLGDQELRAKVLARAGATAVTSAVREVTIQDTVAPARPRLTKVTAVERGVTLTWKAVTTPDLAGYVITATPAGGASEVVKRVGPRATRATVLGLLPDVEHRIEIQAFDEVPNHSASSHAAGIVPWDVTAPGTPSNVDLTPGHGNLSVTWSAPPDTDVARYVVRFQSAGATTWSTTTSTFASVLIDGLADDTAYTVQVAAVDASGNQSAWSEPTSATTLQPVDVTPPGIPAGVNAAALGPDSIEITWEAVSDADLAGYVVEYAVAGEAAWSSLPQESTTSVTIDGLVAETTYTVRVAAVDTTGNQSGWSAPAGATTTA